MYANKFCDAGQVPIFRYFEACISSGSALFAEIKNNLHGQKQIILLKYRSATP